MSYQLPQSAKFINDIASPLPKLLEAGLQYLGVKEFPGSASNPIIMDMAKGLGLGSVYKGDEMSWCAVFINHLIKITGKPPVDTKGDIYNLMRAKWLVNWGEPVRKGEEMLGDIGVFDRPGGGHVAIIVAESPTTFLVLGGNQSNMVSFTEIAKNRLVEARRYYSISPPASVKKYIIDSEGHTSTNES